MDTILWIYAVIAFLSFLVFFYMAIKQYRTPVYFPVSWISILGILIASMIMGAFWFITIPLVFFWWTRCSMFS